MLSYEEKGKGSSGKVKNPDEGRRKIGYKGTWL
jgi:hypothetical protein